MTTQSTDSIQWGALITLPGGATDTEVHHSRGSAANAVDNLNRTLSKSAPARLVYRTVKYGDWSTGEVADQWGVQRTWPDGQVEIEPARSRHLAETHARVTNSSKSAAVAVAVSRSVSYGDWWLATEGGD